MLPEKPWRLEGIARLTLSLLVCVCAGSLGAVALRHAPKPESAAKFFGLTAGAMVLWGVTLALVRRPWQLHRFRRQLAVLLICMYSGFLLGAWAQVTAGRGPVGVSTVQMLVAVLSFQGCALVWIGALLREHGLSWREAFGLSSNVSRASLIGVAAGSLFLPLGWALQRVSGLLMKMEPQQAVETLRKAAIWPDRVALGLVTIALVPVAEEALFRGVLYPWIKQAGFPRLALWVTSIGFAAIHLNMVSFVPLLVFALLLTYLYEKTGNLIAPIVAHGLFNALNFLALCLMDRV
jgi:hypothetical protein